MDIPQLMEIANSLGVKVSQNDELETVIYAILDKAAEDSAANGGATKRKRTRIAKKDNAKVYTVNGAEGESLDPKATKPKKTKQPSLDDLFAEADAKAKEDEQNAANEAAAAEEEEVKPAPKKRGRKSKKELEEIAAREAAETEAQAKAEAQEAAEAPEAEEVIPEASADTSADIDPKAIEELQAKMAQQPAANQGVTPDGVWEGDPGEWLTCPSRTARPSLPSIFSTVR